MLKIIPVEQADLLYHFNSLGDLMMATLPSNLYVRKGEVVAGTRTIPVVVKDALIRRAEALSKTHPIVEILPVPARQVHLIVTGSEVYSGRIQDGFEPVMRKKLAEMGSELADKKLATDDPERVASLIQDAQDAGAELILVSGGMSVDPDDKSPEGIRAAALELSRTAFRYCQGRCF